MGTTGYCWFDRAEVAPFVEPVPGPTTERFHAVAQAHGIHVVIGLPEVDPETGLYYNTAVLIGPDGVVGRHRKTHPISPEPKWSAPGDLGHQVFETPLGRIALLICMDIHFVETARLAALGGADVICHISNWLAERTPAPYWISRAFENGCYLVESNRWGLERTVQFSGGSAIIEPDGAVAAVVDAGDGIAYGEIDLARARDRQVLGEPVFAQRRPELYPELATNTFTWNPSDFFGLYGHRPLPPGRRSRVAVGQFLPGRDVDANLDRIESLAIEAAGQGADLVVFPELSVTGLADAAERAEPLPGRATDRLLAIAARHRLHLVAGLAETEDGRRYNTAVLVGPEGIVGRYRKIHLTGEDRRWATPGDRLGGVRHSGRAYRPHDRPRRGLSGGGAGPGAQGLRPDRLPGGPGRPLHQRPFGDRDRPELSDPHRRRPASLASPAGACRREQCLSRLRQCRGSAERVFRQERHLRSGHLRLPAPGERSFRRGRGSHPSKSIRPILRRAIRPPSCAGRIWFRCGSLSNTSRSVAGPAGLFFAAKVPVARTERSG